MARRFHKGSDDTVAEETNCDGVSGTADQRTISLISHASKILLRILTKRIEAKAKDFIDNNQFGFRKG